MLKVLLCLAAIFVVSTNAYAGEDEDELLPFTRNDGTPCFLFGDVSVCGYGIYCTKTGNNQIVCN